MSISASIKNLNTEAFNAIRAKLIDEAAEDLQAFRSFNVREDEYNMSCIAEDVDKKIENIAKRVYKKIGNITKVVSLEVTPLGFNGIFEGENGNCAVYTILAGGYNVQKRHLRTIIE